MRLVALLLSLLLCSPAWATVNVVRFPSGTPVQVCQPSDTNSNCGGTTSLTIGTTPISSGTNTYLEYNNSGVLGEIPESTFLTSGSALLLDQTTPQTIINGTPIIPSINGSSAANGSLTLQGTSNATRTTSYLNLQPNGGNVGIGTTSPGQKLAIYYGNIRFDLESAPSDFSVALAGVPGNVTNGGHAYAVTFVTANGQTESNRDWASIVVSNNAVNGQVSLTSIPIGSTKVIARKLWRTPATSGQYGSQLQLLATINDNSTTTYTDNIADGSLGVSISGLNTTGGSIYYGSNLAMNINTLNTIFGEGAGSQGGGARGAIFGSGSGANLTYGVSNSLFGYNTGYSLTTGSNDTCIGELTCYYMTSGSANILVGVQAGNLISTGSNSVIMGVDAGTSLTGANGDIMFGYYAGANETASNAFYVNNSYEGSLANDKAYSLLYGTLSGSTGSLSGQQLTVNGTLNINGHIVTHGTAPTLTSCGSSPSIIGNDNAFTITVGGTATGCTATFATAWTNIPSCIVTNQSLSATNIMTYTVSTSAVTISQTALSGNVINVICEGYY